MSKYLIYFIVFLSLFLRLFWIQKVPPSLNWDEVSIGYNAYSILKTGKDEWGAKMPLIFRAYGDYKLPAYVYLTVPFVGVLGFNDISVRLLSVLAGVLGVYFTFLLTNELLKLGEFGIDEKWCKRISLLSSFLVAVEPWTFFIGRIALEANLALTLFILGFYLFLKGLSNPKLMLLSSAFWGLTIWTYNAYRVFTPLFLVSIFLIFKNEIKRAFKSRTKLLLGTLALIFVFIIPMFFQLLNSSGQARYDKVGIIDAGAVGQIINLRKKFGVTTSISRILFNRPTYFTAKFLGNFVSHFNPNFLFIEGGKHYQFSAPGRGILYLIDLPLMLLGFYFILKRRSRIGYILL